MSCRLRSIAITGANKGIGLAVADNLAAKGHWHIILACRNQQRAQQARETLLRKHKGATIETQLLDVANSKSIEAFVGRLKEANRQLDVLVNNAGVYIKQENNGQVVRDTLATNFYGTVQLTEKLLPVIANRGTVVTVGSSLGKYKIVPDQSLRQQFKNASSDRNLLWQLLHHFQRDMDSGKPTYAYPSAYIMSKMAINIYATQLLPKHPLVGSKEIQSYGQCPGYVATDMTEFKGFLPVEKGALTTVYLAELPYEPSLQGGFFERSKPSSL